MKNITDTIQGGGGGGSFSFLLAAIVAVAMAAAAQCAFATPTVTIDKVRQRWPWNNKIDITYTIAGDDEADVADRIARLVITATIAGNAYTIFDKISEGVSAGTHTIVWETPPENVKATDCEMKAEYFCTERVPKGEGKNDYMIVDLVTGAVSYEGLFSDSDGERLGVSLTGQEISNIRYNVDKYKSTHMVLRKIPKGTYQAKGRTGSFAAWTTDKDYYIGIFCWTTAQYGYVIKRTDGTDATSWDDYPLKSRRWNVSQIRGNTNPLGAVPTYASVDAAINAKQWRPLELINIKTGMNFDFPTLLMHEIACRAGTTTTYFWGNSSSAASQYAVYGISNKTRPADTQYCDPVGTKKPNAWGLYDMVGNDWQWCRNCKDDGAPADVFTPGAGGSASIWYVRGQNLYANASGINCDALSSANSGSEMGYSFRAAYVVPEPVNQ